MDRETERIADLMMEWLSDRCPGWAHELPEDLSMADAQRAVARLEAQMCWLRSVGCSGYAKDHARALCNLAGKLPMWDGQDAMGRVRDFQRVWGDALP